MTMTIAIARRESKNWILLLEGGIGLRPFQVGFVVAEDRA
jgi:hypothetical protein